MMLPRPRHGNVVQWLRASKHPRGARHASRKSNPWPEPQGSTEAPKASTWVYPVSRIANFTIVPSEHLFAAARYSYLTRAQRPSCMLCSLLTSAIMSMSSCRSVSSLFHKATNVLTPAAQPRRWLAAQKASFFSLTPEEKRLAGVDTATSDKSKEGSGTYQWYVPATSQHLT